MLGSHPLQLRYSNEPAAAAEAIPTRATEASPPVQSSDGANDRVAKLKEPK